MSLAPILCILYDKGNIKYGLKIYVLLQSVADIEWMYLSQASKEVRSIEYLKRELGNATPVVELENV